MNPGIGLALAAMLCFGVGDSIYKRGAAAGAPPHQLLMLQSALYLLIVAMYASVTGTLAYTPAVLWAFVSGTCMMIGFYNFAASLKAGAVSVVAPVFRMSFVLTAALAVVFLGEALTPFKAAGIALALLATWLLLGGAVRQATGDLVALRGAMVRVVVATIAVGSGYFVMTLALRGGATPGALVTLQACVFTAQAAFFSVRRDRAFRAAPAVLRTAPPAALALACGFVFLAESMARGQASVVVPIAQMGFVVAALVGFLFLRESFGPRKVAGIAAAVAALGCLAHG
ncbi:MAG: EamA family transporter [Burkholderiales bacterium]|nr:EamA family transporter [Burkholderiales bacterium]